MIFQMQAGDYFQANFAQQAARITRRELDHWARAGVVRPSLDPGEGTGSRRLYSQVDIIALRAVAQCREHGVPLAQLGNLAAWWRTREGATVPEDVLLLILADGAILETSAAGLGEKLAGRRQLSAVVLRPAPIDKNVKALITTVRMRGSAPARGRPKRSTSLKMKMRIKKKKKEPRREPTHSADSGLPDQKRR